ncbi:MAG: hypothetical protein ACLFU8_14645 [Anaerolineales bacterium]
MITLNMEEQQIKDMLKQALVEILEERQDLVAALLVEAFEDWAMLQAIREGETTDTVTREAVFEVLERV